jgi:hypothetical protein
MRYTPLAIAAILLSTTAHAQSHAAYTGQQPEGAYIMAPPVNTSERDFVPAAEGIVKEQNGVRYATGGVGEEELAQLKAQESQFNLKLLNTGKKGEFVGTNTVRITNAGGEEVFNGNSDGPLFYIQLPAGSYTVTESMEGNAEQTQKAKVGKGLKQLRFYWNAQD